MSFAEDIAKLSEKIRKNAATVSGEQATKLSLILPFFNALGYDIWDPSEVIPEFACDPGKVGQLERIDYAIAINGKVVILVEAKAVNQKPENHDKQLRKYFTWAQSAKIGIITNGLEYRFFTDLRNLNIMDDEPFFCFNVLEYEPKDLENLKLFHRDNFDARAITQQAETMVFLQGMMMVVGTLLRSPSEEFVKFLVVELGKLSSKYAVSPVTKQVIKKFQPIVQHALQTTLVEMMTRSINNEIYNVPNFTVDVDLDGDDDSEPDTETDAETQAEENRVVTTEEELEAFNRIQAIAAKSTSPHKKDVGYKDVISYFGVHVGKPGWWFLRLYLSSKRKNIVTRLSVGEVSHLCPSFEVEEVGASLGEATSRVIINSVEDIDKLAPLVMRCYEMECERH